MKPLFPLLFLLFTFRSMFAQTLTPLNAPFTQGQPLQFAYTGGTGSPLDWIGIYQHGQTPGNVASTVWQYVPSVSGQVTFDGNLATGNYDIHLFCCDGYDMLASYSDFNVAAERLRSRLLFYKITDTLRFLAMEVSPGDVVALYYASDFSNGELLANAVPIAAQIISSISASQEAALTFAPPAVPEAYVAVLKVGGQISGFDFFSVSPAPVLPPVITRIGTGSCGEESAPEPNLENILHHDIDFFLYTGDNLYIDSYDENVLRAAYENFITGRTEFQKLRATVPLLATWDDHDYGCCDEDADYPIKAASQQIFLDFFEEPAGSPRRTQEGIYTSYTIGGAGQKLQIILLDTRYFLDEKRPNNGCGLNDYCPWDLPADTFRTMLGDVQWAWLKTTLQEPADLRLVATSVQFSSSYHGFESWRLFPHQRKKLQELVKETQAEHLFFVSGDMHYSEVSRLGGDAGLYPLYDFTSSAINESWPPEANMNRVSSIAYGEPNIGLIEIDWPGQQVTFSTLDAADSMRFTYSVPFEEMEFGPTSLSETAGAGPVAFRQIPTPGRGGANLVFEKMERGELSMFDTAGRLLRTVMTENESHIELDGLAAGLYVAELRTATGVSMIKVLVE